MQVAQRGTSFDVNSEDKYTLDRFTTKYSSGTFEATFSQETDAPQEFKNSLKVACDTTYTPLTSDNFGIETRLEGQNLQHLKFGTAGAQDITLSFYVKGTAKQYSCAIQFRDSSNNNYIQTRSFNVTTSWQRVSLTFEGNGAALTTAMKENNDFGLNIQWWLAAGPDDIFAADTTWVANPAPTFHAVTGQDNFFDSTSNEFYITGIQLEVGSVATPFEHRSYGEELARCQRYYNKYGLHQQFPLYIESSSWAWTYVKYPEMRTSPSFSTSGTFTGVSATGPSGSFNISSVVAGSLKTTGGSIRIGKGSGGTNGYWGHIDAWNSSHFLFDAEL